MKRIRLSIGTVAMSLVALLIAAWPGHAATMYAVGFTGVAPGVPAGPVYTIDSDTGVQTLVGNSGIGYLNSLAISPSGVLYSGGGPSLADSNHLVTIDPVTGAGTDLGALVFDVAPGEPGIRGLAADASGNLFGTFVSVANPFNSAFYRINPSTLAATQILADMGPSLSIASLEFSPTGTLYGYSFFGHGLLTINTTTGAATPVGAGSSPAIQSIAFAPNGTLWGVESFPVPADGRLYTIDPTTGALTLAFTLVPGHDIRGIGFLPAPVPVPAAVWLFGSGLAAMVGLARRNSVEW